LRDKEFHGFGLDPAELDTIPKGLAIFVISEPPAMGTPLRCQAAPHRPASCSANFEAVRLRARSSRGEIEVDKPHWKRSAMSRSARLRDRSCHRALRARTIDSSYKNQHRNLPWRHEIGVDKDASFEPPHVLGRLRRQPHWTPPPPPPDWPVDSILRGERKRRAAAAPVPRRGL